MEEHKKTNENLKQNKGITLIALVVTIIVLLILAGISIMMLTGQTGILYQAGLARDKTGRANIIEDAQRDLINKMADEQKEITKEMLKDVLKKYFINVDEMPEDNFSDFVLKDGTYDDIKVSEIYKGSFNELTDGKEIEAGDMIGDNLLDYQGAFVDLKIDINKNKTTEDDWRVFYSENERIFLIAADYVPTSKLEEWNIIGEKGESGELKTDKLQKVNDYCVYWEDEPSESNLENISNDFMKLIKQEYDIRTEEHKINTNSKAVSQLLNTEIWNRIAQASEVKDKIEFCIGGPTVEMWCAAWNANMPDDERSLKRIDVDKPNEEECGYRVSSEIEKNTYYLWLDGTGENTGDGWDLDTDCLGVNYPLFFTQTDIFEDCAGYRLASPSAIQQDCTMGINCYGAVHYIQCSDVLASVRPIICLKKGQKLKEKKVIENKEKVYDIV